MTKATVKKAPVSPSNIAMFRNKSTAANKRIKRMIESTANYCFYVHGETKLPKHKRFAAMYLYIPISKDKEAREAKVIDDPKAFDKRAIAGQVATSSN